MDGWGRSIRTTTAPQKQTHATSTAKPLSQNENNRWSASSGASCGTTAPPPSTPSPCRFVSHTHMYMGVYRYIYIYIIYICLLHQHTPPSTNTHTGAHQTRPRLGHAPQGRRRSRAGHRAAEPQPPPRREPGLGAVPLVRACVELAGGMYVAWFGIDW